MKTFNLAQLLITLIIILSFNSCVQESDFKQQQEENTSTFKIVPFQTKSTTDVENYKVTLNSTIDISNDVIKIEAPTPLADYSRLHVYNISSDSQAAILYLITRGLTDKVVDLPTQYLIQDEISISDLNLDTNLLENGNGLRIFVMNNSVELDVNSDIFSCIEDSVINNDYRDDCSSNNRSVDGPLIFKGYIIEI